MKDKNVYIQITPEKIASLREEDFEDIELEAEDIPGPTFSYKPVEDEEDEEEDNDEVILDQPIFFDFKKIEKIPFDDPKLKELSFDEFETFWNMDIEEAKLHSDSIWDFIRYRYYQLYKIFPDNIRIEPVNCKKLFEKLFELFHIPENSYNKTIMVDKKNKITLNILILRIGDMILYYDGGGDSICLFYDHKYEKDLDSKFYTVLRFIKNFKETGVPRNKIYVVYRSDNGFQKMGFNVKTVNIDLTANYNDDFKIISDTIIQDLNNKKKTGLFILSGEPGTGKTSFIRFLTSKVKRDIIFVSPDMVDQITDPSFIPFLMKNNDSVLIIEDAEPALHKRSDVGRTSAVSNILNLTDGLLSDCLNISILCTFNTTSKDIDDALLRKGRLMMNYHFDRLNIDKSKKLLESLGYKDVKVDKPMTLAEIYYYGKDNNTEKLKTKKIGF